MKLVSNTDGPRPGDLDEHGVPIPDPDSFNPYWHLEGDIETPADDWSPPPDTELDDRPLDDRIETADVHELLLDNPLELVNPAEWESCETPIREWLVEGWIPARQMTFLTGAGAAGKSLLTQQLATCVAMGKPFLGMPVTGKRALYITCEDDYDELHRRQKSICDALHISLRYLGDRLHLLSLMGAVGNELATFDDAGRMTPSKLFKHLLQVVRAYKIGLVVLDNVAHLFTGNENIRNQVAAFCGLLNKLASECQCEVLLIGHPNKAGNDYSGSTAWENQVRSRLFLKIPKEEDGAVLDPDMRVLENGKANYSANGKALEFRWHNMAFLRPEDMPRDEWDEDLENTQDRQDDERFLRALRELNRQGRPVSANYGQSYAPALMTRIPESGKAGKKRLEAAMERLFRAGRIRSEQVGKHAKGKAIFSLVEVEIDRPQRSHSASDFPQRSRDSASHSAPTSTPTAPTAHKAFTAHGVSHSTPYITPYRGEYIPPADAAPPGAGDISPEFPDLSSQTPPDKRRADRDPWENDQ